MNTHEQDTEKPRRINLNLTEEGEGALKEGMARGHRSLTAVVNSALIRDNLIGERVDSGYRVYLRNPEGHETEILWT